MVNKIKSIPRDNILSEEDSKRLHDAFFVYKRPAEVSKPKNKHIVSSSIIIISCILLTAFLIVNSNFNIILIPQEVSQEKGSFKDILLSERIIFTGEKRGSKTIKDVLYITLYKGSSSGFNITFDEPRDLSNSRLVFTLNNPQEKVALEIVLRDSDHYSNARSPFKKEVQKDLKKRSMTFPINLREKTDPRLNLFKIKEIRVNLVQDASESLPVIIKNLFLETGD